MQHVHSLLLGAPAQQDMTIINTTVKGKLFLCLSPWLAEEQADLSTGHISYGRHQKWQTWLTILIVDLELRRLQILYEIGSCQETALKKHLGVMSTNTHYSTTPKVGLAHTDHQLRAQENVLKLEELKRLAINIRNTSGILMEF